MWNCQLVLLFMDCLYTLIILYSALGKIISLGCTISVIAKKKKTVCLFYFFCALAAREERLFQGIYVIMETWKSYENKSQKLLKTVRIEEEKSWKSQGISLY